MAKAKIIEVQFLRVLAIGLVAIAHFPALFTGPEASAMGWPLWYFSYISPAIGVDLFFAISGYLMGATALSRWVTDGSAASPIEQTFEFWRRRFWRLFPASTFWISFTLAVVVVTRDFTLWGVSGIDEMFRKWSASIFQVRNFEEAAHPSPIGYYWSLSLESQFYLLLPLVWFGARRLFWWVVGAGIVVSMFYRFGGDGWYFLRFDGFLWGLVAWRLSTLEPVQAILNRGSSSAVRLGAVIAIVACLALAALPKALSPNFLPLAYSVVAAASAAIMLLAAAGNGKLFIPSWLGAPVNYLGELSYSFYLCHIPIWLLYRQVTEWGGVNLPPHIDILVGMPLAIAFAALSYATIERPFLGRGKNTQR